MDKSMELLLLKLDEKLNQQTKIITLSVTQNVMEALDEKLKIITEENARLKDKISTLEQKVEVMEREKRKYNLVFFGIEEIGKSEAELVDHLKDTIIETGTHLSSQEISNIYRIGKNKNVKNRPVVISVTSLWKKHMILKNRSQMPPGVYVEEDYPKEIIEKRKELRAQMEEERKKGNIAFLRYDKLIVKKSSGINRDKRKREGHDSPNSSSQKKMDLKDNPVATPTKAKEILKPNILNYVERGRTASLSEIPKNL